MLRQRRTFSNYPDNSKVVDSDKKSKYQEVQLAGEITIKFVGDMQQNIDEIVSSINCSESTQQEFKNILKIYASKIDKLREQRNFYKELLFLREDAAHEELSKLTAIINNLKDQLQENKMVKTNCERCTCFDQSDVQTSKFTEDYEGNRISRATVHSFANDFSNFQTKCNSLSRNLNQKSAEQQMLINSKSSKCNREDSLQVSQSIKQPSHNSSQACSSRFNASISEEELMKLMLKYNINAEELQLIFQEYDRQNKQAFELFDSQRQRKLYRLGQRMQKDLWNKKIIKDIKKFTSSNP